MTTSVGSDGGQHIGEQVFVNRFLCGRYRRVEVPLLRGPDQGCSAAGPLDGVLVGQEAHIGTAFLAHLDSPASGRTDLLPHQLGDMRRWPRLGEQPERDRGGVDYADATLLSQREDLCGQAIVQQCAMRVTECDVKIASPSGSWPWGIPSRQ